LILGIGTDITDIRRIARLLEGRGERFIARCFSDFERERVEAGDPALRASGYAKRWAAKEACAKALGLGIAEGVYLRDIAVENDDKGAPRLVLSGAAKERLTALEPRGMTARAHVSLSDEPPLALAFVVISAG
jgi:holo-[acyl-carrier protein] synthase